MVIRVSILLFLFISSSYAQRYRYPVFDSVTVKTYKYAKKRGRQFLQKKMKLDFYQPYGDTLMNRPVIMFIHGGAFKTGSRDKPYYVEFCQNLAKRGYVAISISYTLYLKDKSFNCDTPIEEKRKAIQHAFYDMRLATAFLMDNHKKLGVDPNKIVPIGSSAGAEAVLHGVYYANDTLNLKYDVLPNEFRYAACVSLAGAIEDTSLITTHNSVPTALYHGTCDDLVPYASACHHYCPDSTEGALSLSGSYDIAARLHSLGESYLLHTVCDGGHSLCVTPMREYLDDIVRFIYHTVELKLKKQVRTFERSQTGTCEFWNGDFCGEH